MKPTPERHDCSKLIILISKVMALSPRGRGGIPRAIGNLTERCFENVYVSTWYGAKLIATPSTLGSFTSTAQDYWTLDTCRSLLSDHRAFYDIGANVGYLSLERAQTEPGTVSIVSVEPQQELVDNLVAGCHMNGFASVYVVDACIGQTKGVI